MLRFLHFVIYISRLLYFIDHLGCGSAETFWSPKCCSLHLIIFIFFCLKQWKNTVKICSVLFLCLRKPVHPTWILHSSPYLDLFQSLFESVKESLLPKNYPRTLAGCSVDGERLRTKPRSSNETEPHGCSFAKENSAFLGRFTLICCCPSSSVLEQAMFLSHGRKQQWSFGMPGQWSLPEFRINRHYLWKDS